VSNEYPTSRNSGGNSFTSSPDEFLVDQAALEKVRNALHLRFLHADPRHFLDAEPGYRQGLLQWSSGSKGRRFMFHDDAVVPFKVAAAASPPRARSCRLPPGALREPELLRLHRESGVVQLAREMLRVGDHLPRVLGAELQHLVRCNVNATSVSRWC